MPCVLQTSSCGYFFIFGGLNLAFLVWKPELDVYSIAFAIEIVRDAKAMCSLTTE